jgi:hypothetical protein
LVRPTVNGHRRVPNPAARIIAFMKRFYLT